MVDFIQSAYRHLKDAEYLENIRSYPNAAQLYGFSAECGLKAVLLWKGYPRNSDGSPAGKKNRTQIQETFSLREHIDKLSNLIQQIQSSASGRAASKYLALIPNIGNFNEWKTDHRYYSDQDPIFHTNLERWKIAAKEMIVMVDMAKLDGME